MNIRTIEDNFDYQSEKIFEEMREDYNEEMEVKKINEEATDTFSAWLWNNKEDLGAKFYERVDEYLGIDEFTEEYNKN
jgi:hypothetical protein